MILFGAGALAGVLAPYSRTLNAIRTSELVALAVATAATLIGIVIGALAGYYGGWPDAVLIPTRSAARSASSYPRRSCAVRRRR